MLKIVGVVDDKYRVLDDEDNVEQLATIEGLYVAKATGVWVEGCHFTREGLVADIDGRLCPRGSAEVPEVWRPVMQFNVQESDGRWRYEVSNKGRVRSWCYCDASSFDAPRLMKFTLNKAGYETVHLSRGGYVGSFLVHRLVAAVFVENRRDVYDINHLDECKVSNCSDNLEWCTKAENNAYGMRNARLIGTHTTGIRQYSLDGSLVNEFASIKDAFAAIGGVSSGALAKCCKKRSSNRTYKGFVWRYLDNDELLGVSIEERKCIIDAILGEPTHMLRGVRQYSLDGLFIREYVSIRSAAEQFGKYSESVISGCCRGRYKYSRGYVWRYVDDDEFADRPENKELIAAFHAQVN